MKQFRPIIFLLFVFVFLSCEKFEYNVYETNPEVTDHTFCTQYNIDRLLQLPQKDTLYIVFTGDTQRMYDDVEDLVETVNDLPKVDAVFISGDISDFGTAHEFKLINRELHFLKVPFLTVIGNHDCLANGTKLYEEEYGPLNYAFTWNGIKFIAHNTNGREFNFSGSVPNLDWMQQQLRDTSNYNSCIFLSHVPPFSPDFDPSLEAGYTKLVREAKHTIFSCNGHRHQYELSQPYEDDVWYLNTSSPSQRIYTYVTIYPNTHEGKRFDCSFVSY